MTIGFVWAQSADGVIGVDGVMPWHLPEDLARFRSLTRGQPVVMGHTTWRSLPTAFRPLPGRENLVLSRDPSLVLPGARVLPDVAAVLAATSGRDVWVIGGAQVFALFAARASRAEITDVDVVVGRDGTPAPVLGPGWVQTGAEPATGWATSRTGLRYRFRTLVRPGPSAATDVRSGPGGEVAGR